MVTQFTSALKNSYDYTAMQAEKKSTDREVQENPKKSEVRKPEAIGDYQLKDKVDKLSEKLQSTLLYTKEASKAVAEMMLAKRIEVVV